jgi:hypothetical protein
MIQSGLPHLKRGSHKDATHATMAISQAEFYPGTLNGGAILARRFW